MAGYGKLAEGARPADAVYNTAVSAAHINELQDQLKAMLGPLAEAADLTSFIRNDSSESETAWTYVGGVDPPVLRYGSGTAGVRIGLGPMRAGTKITACAVVMKGDVTGGSVNLYANLISAAGSAKTAIGTWAADPWNTSGAWTVKAATGVLPYTVVANTNVWLSVVRPGGGAVGDVLGVYYTRQMGN